MKNTHRVKAIEKKLNGDDTLQVILPDWLQGDDYVEPQVTGKVIKPSGFLAYDEESNEVFYER